jgi:hypothetical protein
MARGEKSHVPTNVGSGLLLFYLHKLYQSTDCCLEFDETTFSENARVRGSAKHRMHHSAVIFYLKKIQVSWRENR